MVSFRKIFRRPILSCFKIVNRFSFVLELVIKNLYIKIGNRLINVIQRGIGFSMY